MKDLKSAILQATDGGRKIFEDLYPDSRDIFQNKNGKGYIKLRNEKTASASFKLIENNGERYWILKDFGDDTTFNAIDAFIHENNIRFFSEALHRLAEIYHVDCSLNETVNIPRVKYRNAKADEKEGDADYKTRPITEAELKIMGPVVKEQTMEKYKYYALEWYSICKYDDTKKRLIVTTVYSTEDYPMFIHDCGNFKKIYKPFETNKTWRFLSIGTKPKNYVFGLEEAQKALDQHKTEYFKALKHFPNAEAADYGLADLGNEQYKLDKIIICSGERDAMCLAGMDYVPVWFNSESAKKNQDQITELHKLADKIYNVPDSDDTGTEKGVELAREYIEIYTIILPKWLKTFNDSRKRPCKDLRDFIELRPSKAEFEKLIHMAQCAKFWSINPKNYKVEISTLNLLFFLKINGFYKIKDRISNATKYIHITGYTVTEYDPSQIRDFVRNSLREMQATNNVIETYINSKKTTKTIYEDLETIELNFDSSTPDSRTLFFQNICCSISDNLQEKDKENKTIPEKDRGITLSRTPNNGKYVWNTKVIPHRFERLSPSFNIDWKNGFAKINLDNNPSFLLRYLINASRLYWREELEYYKEENLTEEQNSANNEKYFAQNHFELYGQRLTQEQINEQALCFLNKIYIIGYLLHRYKIASNAKAIWAMEWKNNIEGRSNGRSGKSLFINTLRNLEVLSIEYMDGRSTNLTNDNFFLDRVSENTDILWIDDMTKNGDINTFYAMITGSIIIKRKNEKSYELRYEDAPNIVFTSNYAPPNLDPSTIARLLFMTYSDYYHVQSDETDYKEERSVRDDIGEICEKDYTEAQYNADINFCIDCLQFYLACLKKNVPAINPPMQAVKKRAQEQSMGDAFKDWADEYFDKDSDHINHPIVRQKAYEDYIKSTLKTKEQKGKKAWLKALRDYVRFRPDLETLNPEGHPWYRQDRDGLSQRATVDGVTKTYNLLYIKSVDCDILSLEIISY